MKVLFFYFLYFSANIITMLLKIFTILITLFFTANTCISQKSLNLKNKNIKVLGTTYSSRSKDKLSFNRFSDKCLESPDSLRMFDINKARTTTGIRIQFKTKSNNFILEFTPEKGINRGASFAIFRNNELLETIDFNRNESSKLMKIHFHENCNEKEKLYEIVLPSLCNVSLTKFEILDNFELISFIPYHKSTYLAFGNSITHGVGQGSASYLTYPYILAKKTNMDLYNLAVGESKISPAISLQSKEIKQADLITVLLGYNDLMFNDKSVDKYISDYKKFIQTIRLYHPNAEIFCISLTYTRNTQNPRTHIKPDDYRVALKKLVTSLRINDKKIYFVPGEQISNEENLRKDNLQDLVHFSTQGANQFAQELFEIINSVN